MASWKFLPTFVVLSALVLGSSAQNYKVCASIEKVNDCQALERGASRVTCVTVTDTVDCLLKMARDEADFVILTGEETILAALAQPERYNVLASVRHDEKRYQQFAFSAVAVVRADHRGGVQGLEGGGLCHPGYGKSKEQLWSDRVLKYFEKKVTSGTRDCLSESKSSVHDEAHDINRFFSAACRPGSWHTDTVGDNELKKKFPKLCSLCTSDGAPDCNGYRYFEPRAAPDVGNSHLSAMECLASSRGSVAYIAYNHVVDYLKTNLTASKDFALLCENGTVIPLTEELAAEPACAWIRQPWSALISRSSIATPLQTLFKTWMPSGRSGGTTTWIDSLDSVIFRGKSDVLEFLSPTIPPSEYVQKGRVLPTPETNPCHKTLRWCAINQTEFEKCSWVQKAALTAGIRPDIECIRGTSNIDCLKQIKDNRADFQNIDSNFGYLARKFYNQTAVMYEETSNAGRSRVIALIKKSSDVTRFENLRGKNACFPEYGGIAWTAFLRAAHEQKVISQSECDYANEVANFFKAACAPGAQDPAHFPSKVADSTKLCSACRGFTYALSGGANEQGIVTLPTPVDADQECPADFTNRFYGTTGALRCLKETASHVAFIEAQYLSEKFAELSMIPDDYRVLCRNGSVAAYTGFNVDDKCVLSVTIDGEVVARRDDSESVSLQYFLQDLDIWFGYMSNTVSIINMKVFSAFNDTKDVLFKDSTNGLATRSSENENVVNYIKLFEHIDTCSAGPTTTMSSITVLIVSLTIILNKLF